MSPATEPAPCGCSLGSVKIDTTRVSGLCVTCLARRLSEQVPVETDGSLPPGFQNISPLGQGGMGTVVLAFQEKLGRYVALKQISSHAMQDERVRRRFIHEAQMAAQLCHPQLIPLYDFGVFEGKAWYTMEYLEGGDLAQHLRASGGKLPWEEAVAIVQAVGGALAYAHRQGVAHRDIKPANVLLDRAGRPKLGDFGLASLIATDLDLTQHGEVLGTPGYLAPEHLGQRANQDPRTRDQYALVALLFHLIAGRPPFEGDNLADILHAVLANPAPRLREVCPGAAPAWLDTVCVRGLAKDPAHRFDSINALLHALEAGKAVSPRPAVWPHLRSTRALFGLLVLASTAIAWISLRNDHFRDYERVDQTAPFPPGTRVAVLPLDPLGDESLDLLASGLQEEMAATLVRLSSMKVLNTASVRRAESGGDDLRTLASRLGARALVTGSVRQAGESIRVSIQLVDGQDGAIRWSKSFTRPPADLLNLQVDVATELGVELSQPIDPSLRARVLQSGRLGANAQTKFLQARAIANEGDRAATDLVKARTLLAEVCADEPNFALGWAYLSLVNTRLYLWGHDRSQERLDDGLASAQHALRLDPNLPEAEAALALYYMRRSRDREIARLHAQRALTLAPRNSHALVALASIERRTGGWEEATQHYLAALELDPYNPILAFNAADTLLRRRLYPHAAEILHQSLARNPSSVPLRKLQGDLALHWKGDLSAMADELASRPSGSPSRDIHDFHHLEWLIWEERLHEAQAFLAQSALQTLDAQAIYITREALEALLSQMLGTHDRSRDHAEIALRTASRELARSPNDPRLLLLQGQMLCILGRPTEGLAIIERTLSPADPACVDAFDRAGYLTAYAAQLILAGHPERSRSVLVEALSLPGQISSASVKRHPVLKRIDTEIP